MHSQEVTWCLTNKASFKYWNKLPKDIFVYRIGIKQYLSICLLRCYKPGQVESANNILFYCGNDLQLFSIAINSGDTNNFKDHKVFKSLQKELHAYMEWVLIRTISILLITQIIDMKINFTNNKFAYLVLCKCVLIAYQVNHILGFFPQNWRKKRIVHCQPQTCTVWIINCLLAKFCQIFINYLPEKRALLEGATSVILMWEWLRSLRLHTDSSRRPIRNPSSSLFPIDLIYKRHYHTGL